MASPYCLLSLSCSSHAFTLPNLSGYLALKLPKRENLISSTLSPSSLKSFVTASNGLPLYQASVLGLVNCEQGRVTWQKAWVSMPRESPCSFFSQKDIIHLAGLQSKWPVEYGKVLDSFHPHWRSQPLCCHKYWSWHWSLKWETTTEYSSK